LGLILSQYRQVGYHKSISLVVISLRLKYAERNAPFVRCTDTLSNFI